MTVPLLFTFHPVSPDPIDEPPRDAGVETALSTLTADGERIAYLRVGFVTEALAARWPTAAHWHAERSGWLPARGGYTDADLWCALSTFQPMPSRPGLHAWRRSRDDIPDDPDVVAADIATVAAGLEDRFACWKQFMAVPFVAYAHVEERWRRQGIGRRLYLEAAEQLAGTGRVLRASGLQSPEAGALWASFAADGLTSTVSVANPDRGGELVSYLALGPRR